MKALLNLMNIEDNVDTVAEARAIVDEEFKSVLELAAAEPAVVAYLNTWANNLGTACHLYLSAILWLAHFDMACHANRMHLQIAKLSLISQGGS